MIKAEISSLSIQEQYCSRLEEVYSARVSLKIGWSDSSYGTTSTTEVWVTYGVPDCQILSHDAAFGKLADPHPAWASWRVMDEGINWNDIPDSESQEYRHACCSAIEEALNKQW